MDLPPTVYFVDVSGSMYGVILRFATLLATSLPGPAYAIDAMGIREIDDELRCQLLDGSFGGGGTADTLPPDPRWAEREKVLLTDGDTLPSFGACFDAVMVVKDVRGRIVESVMFS